MNHLFRKMILEYFYQNPECVVQLVLPEETFESNFSMSILQIRWLRDVIGKTINALCNRGFMSYRVLNWKWTILKKPECLLF